jgi:hypothetical protein
MYKAIHRERRVLFAAAFMMIVLVILTASLGYEFEHEVQPDKFDTIPAAMYWAVITLASVGYGDLTPITPLGRAMTVAISLIGIGIFAIPAGFSALDGLMMGIRSGNLDAGVLLYLLDQGYSHDQIQDLLYKKEWPLGCLHALS